MKDNKTFDDILNKNYNITKEEDFKLLGQAEDFYVETMRIIYYLSRPAKYLNGKSLEDAAKLVYEYAIRIKKDYDIKNRHKYSVEIDVKLQLYKMIIYSLTEKAYFKNVNTDLVKKMRLELARINGGYLKYLDKKLGLV